MLKQVACKGDVFYGYCEKHEKYVTGILISGASSVLVEGDGVCCKGDIGIGECGCSTMIITGSPSVFVEGKAAAHVMALVANSIDGIILSGASSTSIAA